MVLMSTALGRNIRTLRIQLGMNLEQLALKAGLDPSNLSKIERGVGGYSKDGLQRLSKSLNVPLGTLFAESPGEEVMLTGRTRVPILADNLARRYVRGETLSTEISQSEHILVDRTGQSRIFGHRVNNSSMVPEFRPGDIVVVDPAVLPEPSDYVVVDSGSGILEVREYRLKKISVDGTREVELAALNAAYPSYTGNPDKLVILGCVVDQHRKRK